MAVALDNYRFRIADLSQLDKVALSEELAGSDAVFEESKRSKSAHNELATLALIGSIGVLSSLAAYLFGKRKSTTLSLAVEVIAPDGERRHLTLDLSQNSVDPVQNQIFSQLSKSLGNANG